MNTTLSRSRQSSRTAVCLLLFAFVITGFCTALPLAAQNEQPARPANRILDPIDEAASFHSKATSILSRQTASTAAPRLFPRRRTISICSAERRAAAGLLAICRRPAEFRFAAFSQIAHSRSVRHAIQHFRPDLATVEAWMQSHGFKIENVPQARNMVEFSGNSIS